MLSFYPCLSNGSGIRVDLTSLIELDGVSRFCLSSSLADRLSDCSIVILLTVADVFELLELLISACVNCYFVKLD